MIYVCNIEEMPIQVAALAPSHLVSLVSSAEQPPTPPPIGAERHHRVEIHDISEPLDDHVLPASDHVDGLIRFVRRWPADEGALLVHCIAGVSRSMAAALITLVVKAPGREDDAARHLRRLAPHAWPNRRIIALADPLLGCDGRLVAAREAMGAAEITLPTPVVGVPLLD